MRIIGEHNIGADKLELQQKKKARCSNFESQGDFRASIWGQQQEVVEQENENLNPDRLSGRMGHQTGRRFSQFKEAQMVKYGGPLAKGEPNFSRDSYPSPRISRGHREGPNRRH